MTKCIQAQLSKVKLRTELGFSRSRVNKNKTGSVLLGLSLRSSALKFRFYSDLFVQITLESFYIPNYDH